MEIPHDAAEARAARAQGGQHRGGVGIEQLGAAGEQPGAVGQDIRVAAGILDEGEPPRFCHEGQQPVRQGPLVGGGALVHAEGDVRHGLQDALQAGKQHVVRILGPGKAVGHQHHVVHTGVRHAPQLPQLVVHAVGHMTGGHHAQPATGSLHHPGGKGNALVLAQAEHLAGQAYGENALAALIRIKVHQTVHSLHVQLIVNGVGGNHGGIDSGRNPLHGMHPPCAVWVISRRSGSGGTAPGSVPPPDGRTC